MIQKENKTLLNIKGVIFLLNLQYFTKIEDGTTIKIMNPTSYSEKRLFHSVQREKKEIILLSNGKLYQIIEGNIKKKRDGTIS